ncbi:MAG: RnfABCDGE type electron transport complex subunit G [Chlorobi bacterium]|nr:RnfABCDGE type electron transport complex subunit G [Chlorobiota bacterium]
MAKKESTLTSMVLTLFLVSLIASTILGFVYEFTKEPIAAAKLKKKNDAINVVVPNFTNNPGNESFKVMSADNLDSLTFYPAYNDSTEVGMAVETFSKKGFGGKISLMVGFLPDGTISEIAVLDHKETPGLGEKMQRNKSNFHVQFKGKNPAIFKLSVKKDGGDVDAITASTISSRAYCDAVKRAYDTFESIKK